MAEPEHLQPESLEWARTHVSRFGDTNLPPVPFEYKAIEADWLAIKKTCSASSFANTRPGLSRNSWFRSQTAPTAW